MADETRNLNPIMPARVAMIIWGKEYSEQRGGSMDFWDSLDDYRKRTCVFVVEALLDELEKEKENVFTAKDLKKYDPMGTKSVEAVPISVFNNKRKEYEK